MRTNLTCMLIDAALALIKILAGMYSGALSITFDGINSLADELTSLLSIADILLKRKQPNRRHPAGYDRVRFLCKVIVAAVIINAALTSLFYSVKRFLSAQYPTYGYFILVAALISVVASILKRRYVMDSGHHIHSDVMENLEKKCVINAGISLLTVLCALITLIFHKSPDAILGILLALFLLSYGILMLLNSTNSIFNVTKNATLEKEIKRTISSVDGIFGAYDLQLHNYGPDQIIGCVQIEVPDYYTAAEIDEKSQEIIQAVYSNHNVTLTSIGIYSRNMKNDETAYLCDDIRRTVMSHEYVLQMHGFYADVHKKMIRFDLVIDYSAPNRTDLFDDICHKIREEYPTWTFSIVLN